MGIGAGNAVFPLLSANRNPLLTLRAYDYSSHAVKLVQTNPLYLSPSIGSIRAAVWDLSSSELPPDVEPESVDIIILVFVLSALHPDEWRRAIANIHKMLKPGGLVLFRDYGRYDLTQLRFKGGRLLEENFYIRGDKTRVYFFDVDELALLFTGSLAPATATTNSEVKTIEEYEDDTNADSPLPPFARSIDSPSERPLSPLQNGCEASSSSQSSPRSPATHSNSASIHPVLLQTPFCHHPLFSIEQLGVDRRLIVNRKRQLKMYRVWMQGKFRKIGRSSDGERIERDEA